MAKKKSKLQLAQEKVEALIRETNVKINELGIYDGNLYDSLTAIQNLFDEIRNVPNEEKLKYEELKKVSLNWKQQVDKIAADYKKSVAKNTGSGAAGVGVGVAVAALGPTAAMGVATTFGVASTGTAISALSGAAATNAALAWLGGGALWAGGGGMIAGKALLALAGPIGWAIAGAAILSSGIMFWKAHKEKEHLENIFTLIAERDAKSYELAIVELNERISRIKKETVQLWEAVAIIRTYGTDYSKMTEAQQYTLGSYLNLMNSSIQLLINPILGLQAKYTEVDLKKFVNAKNIRVYKKSVVIFLANMLYKIKIDDNDKKLLWKTFRNNKELLKTLDIEKHDFEFSVFETVFEVLKFKG